MIDYSSWRMNYHNKFLSYGIGFYIENNSHYKGCIDEEKKCKHIFKWERPEGWTQCRDCYKILSTKKSLMMGMGNEATIRQVKKMRREYKKLKKPYEKNDLEGIGRFILSTNHPLPVVQPIREPITVQEIIPDIRSVNDLYNNFFRK